MAFFHNYLHIALKDGSEQHTAHDTIKNNLPSPLQAKVTLVDTAINTRNEDYYQLDKPTTKTIRYGTNSIKSKSVDIWNTINRIHYTKKLHDVSRSISKSFVKKYFIEQY